VRRRLGLEEGDVLTVELSGRSIVLTPAVVSPIELYTDERIAEFAAAAALAPAEAERARGVAAAPAVSPRASVSAPPLVFLDANVLFSAAVGGPAFELLLGLARARRVRLVTIRECLLEAERNLERKRADRRPALARVLARVAIADLEPADEHAEWARQLVALDDVHVLAAARAILADVLVTGDVTHFGRLRERDDLPLRVRTPRTFLLEGPG